MIELLESNLLEFIKVEVVVLIGMCIVYLCMCGYLSYIHSKRFNLTVNEFTDRIIDNIRNYKKYLILTYVLHLVVTLLKWYACRLTQRLGVSLYECTNKIAVISMAVRYLNNSLYYL